MEKLLILLKWLGLATLVLLILFIGASYINHTIQLSREKSAFPPPGKMISVNGHQMHVYVEGRGNPTLVFIAGSGTSSPTFNFKPVFQQLSTEYQIAVIERAGYGWSEVGSTPRDIDTLLFENRHALELAAVEPPYVLFAHSMGALEALYWADQHPEEIVAIIGLDPAVPEAYRYLQQPSPVMINFLAFLARTGITRLSPDVCKESLAIQENYLTAEEADAFCAIFYRSTLTKNMLQEIKFVNQNALQVEELGPPDVPLLFFISDGVELGMENWRAVLIDYLNSASEGHFYTADTGHYIHNHVPDLIIAESRIFLEEVLESLN